VLSGPAPQDNFRLTFEIWDVLGGTRAEARCRAKKAWCFLPGESGRPLSPRAGQTQRNRAQAGSGGPRADVRRPTDRVVLKSGRPLAGLLAPSRLVAGGIPLTGDQRVAFRVEDCVAGEVDVELRPTWPASGSGRGGVLRRGGRGRLGPRETREKPRGRLGTALHFQPGARGRGVRCWLLQQASTARKTWNI